MAVWLRQPAFLLFGLMGPLVALTQSAVRRTDTEAADKKKETTRVRLEQENYQQATCAASAWADAQEIRYPRVDQWLQNPLWRPPDNTPEVAVRVGLKRDKPPVETGLDEKILSPLALPLHANLAVIGPPARVQGVWRAMSCQALAILANPGQTPGGQLVATGRVWAENSDPPPVLDIPHPSGELSHRWGVVANAGDIPPESTWVVSVDGAGNAAVFHRGVSAHQGVEPDSASFATARWVRARLVACEGGSSLEHTDADPTDRNALWCDVSPSHEPIDLVSQGPHSLVWGKTGSGKSVLVQRLVASLCGRYSPRQLSVVGIDFKGGATVNPLHVFPHVQGVLTDLTPRATNRVTRSLAQEIRRREQLFAHHQVATWSQLPEDVLCPRVLIVVDEAGVVAHNAPELIAVISDIASRGRSLGLHLLMATQRPQHIPKNIIANCAVRLCLTITDSDEATQYLPDVPAPLLARLRTSPPGTLLAPSRQHQHVLVTVEPPTLPDSEGARNPALAGHSKTLWCEELPADVPTTHPAVADFAATPGRYLVGLGDYPDSQSQAPVWFDPRRDGPLVILGETASGHTTCLRALSDQAEQQGATTVWGSGKPEVLCHQIIALHKQLTVDNRSTLLCVDRLDRVMSGCSPETKAWVVDNLYDIARTLSERGGMSGAVISCAPGGDVFPALARWSTTTGLLRHRDREQWALSGGEPTLHDPASPPGRAVVAGTLTQWLTRDGPARVGGAHDDHREEGVSSEEEEEELPPAPAHATVIAGGPHQAGDVNALSVSEAESSWHVIRQALETGPGVVFVAVSTQQMRQLVGPGYSTPPVTTAWPHGWLVTTEGVSLVAYRPPRAGFQP